MLTPDYLFIILIMNANTLVLTVLSLPKYRRRLPKIYWIARSWWWMLALLFGCYLVSSLQDKGGHYAYWWALDGLFVLIGLRGLYEISRLGRLAGKTKLLHKLATQVSALERLSEKKATEPALTNITPKAEDSAIPLVIHSRLDALMVVSLFTLIISLIFLHHLTWAREASGILLFVLFASQFNDIAQYLCGRAFGGRFFQRKLAPKISPNKTIEGALFGTLLSAILATILGLWLTTFGALVCFGCAYLLAVSGVMGDLFESAFKRRHGVKDTGTLLAGHGGVLDRIDSLLIGIPLFTLLYWLLL